ncbi:hypothetical protein [Moraxella lacunata]|uniref:hypothetical protein n=1 Tax=Moraxella lacunata TaxID=477 RepID=UPI003EE06EA8
MCNFCVAIFFNSLIQFRNDGAIFPRLNCIINQGVVEKAIRPTVGNINKLQNLHRGEILTVPLCKVDKLVGNSNRTNHY